MTLILLATLWTTIQTCRQTGLSCIGDFSDVLFLNCPVQCWCMFVAFQQNGRSVILKLLWVTFNSKLLTQTLLNSLLNCLVKPQITSFSGTSNNCKFPTEKITGVLKKLPYIFPKWGDLAQNLFSFGQKCSDNRIFWQFSDSK